MASRAYQVITTYALITRKKKQILAQFAAASFVIAEIMRCRPHGDKLCWTHTKFKLVAYLSNLLSSKYNILGEGMKEMLGIAGDQSLLGP